MGEQSSLLHLGFRFYRMLKKQLKLGSRVYKVLVDQPAFLHMKDRQGVVASWARES